MTILKGARLAAPLFLLPQPDYNQPPMPGDLFLYNRRALSRLRDRSRYIWHFLTTPKLADADAGSLPRPLRVIPAYAASLLRALRNKS